MAHHVQLVQLENLHKTEKSDKNNEWFYFACVVLAVTSSQLGVIFNIMQRLINCKICVGLNLAQQAASSDFIGPEPALGLSAMSTKRIIRKWSVCEQNKRWHNLQGCRQAKQLMLGVNTRLSKYALRLPRRDVRILVGLLTGHNTLNRHLRLGA